MRGALAALGVLVSMLSVAFGMLARAFEVAADALFGAITALAEGMADLWLAIDVYTRRRVGAAIGLAAAIALFLTLAVPALPCQFPGGDQCPPGDDAIDLVPADALGYVHVDLDSGTQQYEEAAGAADAVPALSHALLDIALGPVPGLGGSAAGFDKAVRPWIGGQAAVGLLPAAGGAQEVVLLQAADAAGARRFAGQIAPGARIAKDQGVVVRTGNGVATALVRGFLVIGTERGTRAVVETATGARGAKALSAAGAANGARSLLPSNRLADAYLSPAGIRKLVAKPNAALATLGPFVSPRASRGFAAALVAGNDTFELDLRSRLDPGSVRKHPGFFTAFPSFEPSLAADLPSVSLGYLGLGAPGRTFKSLLGQVNTEEPGLARGFARLAQQVSGGREAVLRRLLAGLGGEAAVVLESPPTSGRSAPAGASAPVATGPPAVGLVASDVDVPRARQAIAKLQSSIARALGPVAGVQPPSFQSRRVGGVSAQVLNAPGSVQLSYAFVHGDLVVATRPAALARLAGGSGGLAGTSSYRGATEGFPGSVSLVGYLDLHELLPLLEQVGLAENPAYAAYANDLRRLDSLGVGVSASRSELATDIRVSIGARESEPSSATVAPPAGR